MHTYVKDLRPTKGYTGELQRLQDVLVFVRVLTKEHAQVIHVLIAGVLLPCCSRRAIEPPVAPVSAGVFNNQTIYNARIGTIVFFRRCASFLNQVLYVYTEYILYY